MLQLESTQTIKLTFEHTTLGFGVLDSLLEQLVCVLRDVGDETDAGRVNRGVCQVSIVEDDCVGLEKRGTQAPAVKRTFAGSIGTNNVLGDTSCGVTSGIRGDKITRVEREHLAAKLEGQVMWCSTRESRL